MGLYLGVELPGHMATLCLTFWRIARLFSKVVAPFYIITSSVWEFQFLNILSNSLLHGFLITAILAGMKWYLIVVLLCISLMVNDAEHFFTWLWAMGHGMSSLEKCLSKSFAHSLIGSLVFNYWAARVLYSGYKSLIRSNFSSEKKWQKKRTDMLRKIQTLVSLFDYPCTWTNKSSLLFKKKKLDSKIRSWWWFYNSVNVLKLYIP